MCQVLAYPPSPKGIAMVWPCRREAAEVGIGEEASSDPPARLPPCARSEHAQDALPHKQRFKNLRVLLSHTLRKLCVARPLPDLHPPERGILTMLQRCALVAVYEWYHWPRNEPRVQSDLI